MLTVLFYVVIGWVLFSLGRGVYASVADHATQEKAINTVVSTLRLPYDVVMKLFKK